MDKKKTKKEATKKSAKPLMKKVEAKPPKKVTSKKAKPVAAKAAKKPLEKARPEKSALPSSVAGVRSTAVAEAQSTAGVVVETARPQQPSAPKKSYLGPTLRLRWFRSAIGLPEKQKRVVQGLGFRHLNEIVVRPDTPMIRGMVNRIPHLVEIVE